MQVSSKKTRLVLTITLEEGEVEEICRAYPTDASERTRKAWEAVEEKYGSIAEHVFQEWRKTP